MLPAYYTHTESEQPNRSWEREIVYKLEFKVIFIERVSCYEWNEFNVGTKRYQISLLFWYPARGGQKMGGGGVDFVSLL